MNAKKYEYNGQKLTECETTQKQRQIERNIRKWKREYIGIGGRTANGEAASKLARWQNVQKDFIEQTGLKGSMEGRMLRVLVGTRRRKLEAEVIARNRRERLQKYKRSIIKRGRSFR